MDRLTTPIGRDGSLTCAVFNDDFTSGKLHLDRVTRIKSDGASLVLSITAGPDLYIFFFLGGGVVKNNLPTMKFQIFRL